MDELLLIINKDFRRAIGKSILSRFDLSLKTVRDDFDEGEDIQHWLTDTRNGIQIEGDSNYLIKTIFLHSGKKNGEEFMSFPYQLSGQISFDDSKNTVQKNFGKPSLSGESSRSRFLGEIGGYDRYDYEKWSIHFQYSVAGEQIDLITIMSPDVVPLPKKLLDAKQNN